MIRNLTTLVLALVATLALSVTGASAAPKLTPVPEEYPVTVEGEQATAVVLELQGGRKVECASATFAGETVNQAEAAQSKLTVKPTYSGCTATILGNVDLATITMNECDYLLTTTETTPAGIAAEGWELTGKENHIQCPVGHGIEIHVFTTEAKDLENRSLCTYKIGAQTPAGDLDYKLLNIALINEGLFFWWAGTSADIKSTLTGIAATRVAGTETNCGAAAQNAELKGEFNMKWIGKLGALRGRFED